ncbi:hypothetical protein EON64_14650, partial [archaeon]
MPMTSMMKPNPNVPTKLSVPPPGMRLSHPGSPNSADEEEVRVLTSPTIHEELDQLSLGSDSYLLGSSFDSYDRQQVGLLTRNSASSYDSNDPSHRMRSSSLDSDGQMHRYSHGR